MKAFLPVSFQFSSSFPKAFLVTGFSAWLQDSYILVGADPLLYHRYLALQVSQSFGFKFWDTIKNVLLLVIRLGL